MCDCHSHSVTSYSTTCPGDFIAGQMGILLKGGADGQEGDVVWVAQDTWQSAKALMGTPATVHMEAASMWVHVVIYLYLSWPALNRDLSNSSDTIGWLAINRWLIWPCAYLQKLFKSLPRRPCMVEKQAFPHTYLYSGTRMKCPRLSILQSWTARWWTKYIAAIA